MEEAQALTTAKLGPLKPWRMEIWPAAISKIIFGIKKGLNLGVPSPKAKLVTSSEKVINPPIPEANNVEKYEVVIAGAAPAGLMLNLLLARYGLSDESLLCVDAKSTTLKSGQADGLQPRTLETLKSLGLADEILTEGCQMWQVFRSKCAQ